MEGKEEREKCYAPIIEAVVARYPDPKGVNILVPGAGLGRLAFDFASMGTNYKLWHFVNHFLNSLS